MAGRHHHLQGDAQGAGHEEERQGEEEGDLVTPLDSRARRFSNCGVLLPAGVAPGRLDRPASQVLSHCDGARAGRVRAAGLRRTSCRRRRRPPDNIDQISETVLCDGRRRAEPAPAACLPSVMGGGARGAGPRATAAVTAAVAPRVQETPRGRLSRQPALAGGDQGFPLAYWVTAYIY